MHSLEAGRNLQVCVGRCPNRDTVLWLTVVHFCVDLKMKQIQFSLVLCTPCWGRLNLVF